PPEQLQRPAQVTEILQVSFVQIYPHIRAGELPAIVFGKSVRFQPYGLMNVDDEYLIYGKSHTSA
ncbi:MAG: helix-turn-helix domain-containing protein, partial [Anaerolineae bacterium]|nr:helix-turn-helix domain-containing protein [Anaerolineae bacterium]